MQIHCNTPPQYKCHEEAETKTCDIEVKIRGSSTDDSKELNDSLQEEAPKIIRKKVIIIKSYQIPRVKGVSNSY